MNRETRDKIAEELVMSFCHGEWEPDKSDIQQFLKWLEENFVIEQRQEPLVKDSGLFPRIVVSKAKGAGNPELGEWTSVNDRLPEIGQVVILRIAQDEDGNPCNYYEFGGLFTTNAQGGSGWSVAGERLYPPRVTHWREVHIKRPGN